MFNKQALITGATSGIGAAFAEKLASLGYDLIITGRREQKISELASRLNSLYCVDIKVKIIELADADELDSFINEIREENIEVLINNAGFTISNFFNKIEAASHESMIDVHITAPVKIVYAVIPGMLKRGSGIIINVSSLSAFLPRAKSVMYSSTKIFLKNFSEALYAEFGTKGIKVQALCPGFTRTDFHEKMGMDNSELTNKGLVKWMTAEKVVYQAWKSVNKGKIICIPGFSNVILSKLGTILPSSLYYKIMRSK